MRAWAIQILILHRTHEEGFYVKAEKKNERESQI